MIAYVCRKRQITLTLSGELTVASAGEVRDTLLRAADEPKAEGVCLDMTGVERMDISAVQLLLALRNDCSKKERKFSVTGMPPSTEHFFAQIGITL